MAIKRRGATTARIWRPSDRLATLALRWLAADGGCCQSSRHADPYARDSIAPGCRRTTDLWTRSSGSVLPLRPPDPAPWRDGAVDRRYVAEFLLPRLRSC